MEIIKTNIEGVLIFEPRLFRDAREYFFLRKKYQSIIKLDLSISNTMIIRFLDVMILF